MVALAPGARRTLHFYRQQHHQQHSSSCGAGQWRPDLLCEQRLRCCIWMVEGGQPPCMLAHIGIEQSKFRSIVSWCVMAVSCAYTVHMGGSEGRQTLNLVLITPDPLGQACFTVFGNHCSHMPKYARIPIIRSSHRQVDVK